LQVTAEDIREARKSLGMTQEQLASKMLVDVTTVQRWEAGRTEPSLAAGQRLKNLLVKPQGLDHPLSDMMLEAEYGTAILDEHAVYRKVNTAFLEHMGLEDQSDLIGRYCFDVRDRLRDIWRRFRELAGASPEDLLFGDFDRISAQERFTRDGTSVLYIHSLTAIRQTNYSGNLAHCIEIAGTDILKGSEAD